MVETGQKTEKNNGQQYIRGRYRWKLTGLVGLIAFLLGVIAGLISFVGKLMIAIEH